MNISKFIAKNFSVISSAFYNKIYKLSTTQIALFLELLGNILIF